MIYTLRKPRLVSMIMILVFVGCIIVSGAGLVFSQEKQEVRIITWDMRPEWWKVIQEELPPQYKVTYLLCSGGQIGARLLTQMVTKTPPDLVIASPHAPWANWAYDGLLHPIDEFVKRDNYDLSIWRENSRDMFVAIGPDGKKHRYAQPYYTGAQETWFLNRDMFDEAGLAYPTNNDTWDDFLSDSQKLTKDIDGDGTPDIWGYTFHVEKFTGKLAWPATNGTDGWTEDGKNVYDDPRFVRAFQFLTDLTFKYKVAPVPELHKWRIWHESKVAQVFTYHDRMDNYRRGEVPFAWDLRLPPKGPDGPRRLPITGYSYVMTANARNKQGAWEVMKILWGPEYAEMLFEGGDWDGIVTSMHRKDFYEKMSTPEYRKELLEAMPYPTMEGLEALDMYVKEGFVPFWQNNYMPPEVEIVQRRFDNLWGGRAGREMDIAELFREISQTINRIMGK